MLLEADNTKAGKIICLNLMIFDVIFSLYHNGFWAELCQRKNWLKLIIMALLSLQVIMKILGKTGRFCGYFIVGLAT